MECGIGISSDLQTYGTLISSDLHAAHAASLLHLPANADSFK